ncbi:MAG: CPBP family glutamic-type intramembrane protease [Planctomycetota bacterium]
MNSARAAAWIRRILVGGIVAAWLGLTYNPHWGWWISGLASTVILALGILAFGNRWPERLGLSTGARGALVFLAATAVALPASIFLIDLVARDAGVSFSAAGILDNTTSLAFTLGQTFNEEVVIGALLLLTLDRRFPARRGPIAVGVAALFACMHVALYASPHRVILYGAEPFVLDPLTILSLFAVGVLRNNAILARGDIALAWAIHLAFNIPFFVGHIWSADGDPPLTEPEQFDAILGHPWMAALTVVLAAASFGLYRLNRRADATEPTPSSAPRP